MIAPFESCLDNNSGLVVLCFWIQAKKKNKKAKERNQWCFKSNTGRTCFDNHSKSTHSRYSKVVRVRMWRIWTKRLKDRTVSAVYRPPSTTPSVVCCTTRGDGHSQEREHVKLNEILPFCWQRNGETIFWEELKEEDEKHVSRPNGIGEENWSNPKPQNRTVL